MSKEAIKVAAVLLFCAYSPEIRADEVQSALQASEEDDLSFAARSALVAGGFIAGAFAGIALAVPTFYLTQSFTPDMPFFPIAFAVGAIGVLASAGAGISAAFVAKFPIPLIVVPTALACTGVGCAGFLYFMSLALSITEQLGIMEASDTLSQLSLVLVGSATILLLVGAAVGIEAGIGSIAFE